MAEKRDRYDHESQARPTKKQKHSNRNEGSWRLPSSQDQPSSSPQHSRHQHARQPHREPQYQHQTQKHKPKAAKDQGQSSNPAALLKSLLEQLSARDAKATIPVDPEVTESAEKLHALLYDPHRPSPALRALNNKRPETAPLVHIPSYNSSKPLQSHTILPPLPEVKSGYLSDAPFTHVSINEKDDQNTPLNYEKLEFLGDSYIEVISTRLIYSRFPHLTTGHQSQIREKIVRNESLAEYAKAYGFEERIRHGHREGVAEKLWTKVLADAFEAYVAAVILSDPEFGFVTVEKWLTELWAEKLLAEGEVQVTNSEAKNELGKLLHAHGMKEVKLEYKEERPMFFDRRTGRQNYYIAVYLTGWGFENKLLGTGEGQNKAQAGAAAATFALNDPASRKIVDQAHAKKLEYDKKRQEKKAAAMKAKEDASSEGAEHK